MKPSPKYIITNQSLSVVSSFLAQSIISDKVLKDAFRNHNKWAFKESSLDHILEYLVEQTQNKVAIDITNTFKDNSPPWACTKELYFYEGMNENQAAKVYQENKEFLLKNAPDIYPLYDIVKSNLRTLVIQYYFAKEILPSISPKMIENCNIYGHLGHIKYSWSFISSFKKKLLGEYADKELYWIRLVFTEAAKKLVNDNIGDTRKMAKNKDLKVFYPNPYMKRNQPHRLSSDSGLEYIDIFTTDSTLGHFLLLTDDTNIVGFAADLTPLIKNLQDLELLNI